MSDLLSGVVLAGGESRRMGRDKALLPVEDTVLLAWVARRLAVVCSPVVIVTRPNLARGVPGFAVVEDRSPGAGPLAGLHAGLEAVPTEYAAVVSCDLPLLDPGVVAAIAERRRGWDAVVPVVAGRAQPLHAVYRRRVAELAEHLLRQGTRSLRALLEHRDLRVRWLDEADLRPIDPDLSSFTNVNTPEDYERSLARLKRGSGSRGSVRRGRADDGRDLEEGC